MSKKCTADKNNKKHYFAVRQIENGWPVSATCTCGQKWKVKVKMEYEREKT